MSDLVNNWVSVNDILQTHIFVENSYFKDKNALIESEIWPFDSGNLVIRDAIKLVLFKSALKDKKTATDCDLESLFTPVDWYMSKHLTVTHVTHWGKR